MIGDNKRVCLWALGTRNRACRPERRPLVHVTQSNGCRQHPAGTGVTLRTGQIVSALYPLLHAKGARPYYNGCTSPVLHDLGSRQVAGAHHLLHILPKEGYASCKEGIGCP